MRLLLTVVLSVSMLAAAAQWSNTTNTFKDSLHMPVTTAVNTQQNPIIVNSYPDGGYFVIWEDNRNAATKSTDIYAQKYDKYGTALWATDGVPVAADANRDHFTYSSSADYRTHSYAATDSSGGFYIAYANDSIKSYTWERLTLQHVRGNGTNVFNGGYILIRSGSANLQMMPQLIADGNKGFFVAYKTYLGNDYVNMYCYKDEGGKLKYYGGGRANENILQTSSIAPCGTKTDLVFPGTTVSEFNIWSDKYGGCHMVINMNGNTGLQGNMLVYNRLWRAKKNAVVKTYMRNNTGASCPRITEYQKDDVYMLYIARTDFQDVHCGTSSGNAYSYTNFRVLSNGFKVIDNKGAYYYYPKGLTLDMRSTRNINVDLIAVARRTYENNTLSPYIVYGYAYPSEKFDSVPYQRCSFNNPDRGFNETPLTNLTKLNNFRDTLLGTSTYYPDFSIATGGTSRPGSAVDAYITGIMEANGKRMVRLQHLSLSNVAQDTFGLDYKNGGDNAPTKIGVAIGQELNTSFSGDNITYDLPQVAVNVFGDALFYVGEYARGIRISPITGVAKLTWGAMGRTTGYGVYANSYYRADQGVIAPDMNGAGAMLAWRDQRNLGTSTAENIFMRHLDSLRNTIYTPPLLKIQPLYQFTGQYAANPAVLLGTSKTYTPIESSSISQFAVATPVASILDTIYLGRVVERTYYKSGAARAYNGQPYLARNFTFYSDTLPPKAVVDMKLFFSKEEFDLLKTADPTIKDISYLGVIHQPNATVVVPDSYIPIAGEEILTPLSYDTLDGGYALRINTRSLGNFFIQKISSGNACAAGSRSFVSNITGTNYQWQVNTTGAGFANISNGGNYSGTTTATLQINNIPTLFNGYRYRCIVGGTKISNTFDLNVDNRWTGAASNLWENAANWSCGKVPDAATDVVIKAGTITVNSAAVCKSLSVSTGVSLTITPGFNLKIMQ